MDDISWIATDWGTTHLRVWAIGPDQSVVGQASSPKGMNSLQQDQFEGALLELIEGWLPADRLMLVIACGMVGARQGWIETEYIPTPARPLTPGHFQSPPVADPRLRVLIVPGLARHDPADVMRGEETQIAGLLAEHPGFEGTVFMPGTHCKWVRVASGEIVDFKTCMTGELFSLLERQSILRHSLKSGGFDLDAFNKTITSALEAPGSAITDLFSVRADDLLKGVLPGVSRAKLSAYLIAGEVLAAKRLWQDQNLVLLGDNELVSLYKTALHAAGADAESADGTGLTIAGLIAAKALVEETR